MNIIEQSNDFCLNYLSYIKKTASSFHISFSQALCLNAIPFDGISQSKLANKLSVDLSTLSRNLDKLIKLNLIHKKVLRMDKRSYKITLSADGKILFQKFNNTLYAELNKIYANLNIDDINQIEELLNKLNWQFTLYEK